MSDPIAATPMVDATFLHELTEIVVTSLQLEVSPDDIDPDAPLYGDGLGLDSIDILELALVMSKRFGVQLRADDANTHHIFGSLRSLADYVAAHRTL